jgi:hypothetical protein
MVTLFQKDSHGLNQDSVGRIPRQEALNVFCIFYFFFHTKQLVYTEWLAYYEVQKNLSRKKVSRKKVEDQKLMNYSDKRSVDAEGENDC